MAIKSDFNVQTTYKELKIIQGSEYIRMVEQMKKDARKFLKDTRGQAQGHELGFYNDQTMKLRESIAVYILRNGIIIWADESGNTVENRRLIMEGPISRIGFTTVAIAGKDYASVVESKGYNVISAQGHTFVADIGVTFSKMRSYGRV